MSRCITILGLLAGGLSQSGCGECNLLPLLFATVEVRDAQTGDLLEDAMVVCQGESRNQAGRTGPGGVFSCGSVEPVRIRVSQEGYQSREIDVDVGEIDRCGQPEDGPLRVDISLEPVSS